MHKSEATVPCTIQSRVRTLLVFKLLTQHAHKLGRLAGLCVRPASTLWSHTLATMYIRDFGSTDPKLCHLIVEQPATPDIGPITGLRPPNS